VPDPHARLKQLFHAVNPEQDCDEALSTFVMDAATLRFVCNLDHRASARHLDNGAQYSEIDLT
jgi:hypothetical protein